MNVTELWVAIAKLLADRQAMDPATLTVCINDYEITGLNVLGSRLVLETRETLRDEAMLAARSAE